MNLYIQEQSDDKYFQGQGKYRQFFLWFVLNMLICAFSAPKSKASTLFHSDQTIKTLQRVTSQAF